MKNKRVIGEELLRFVDGDEKTVQIHAVGNYYVTQTRKKHRQTLFDKKGQFQKVDFNEHDFYIDLAKMSMGSDITIEELKDVDNIDWKDFYEKYFELSNEKKLKSPDIADLEKDNKSEE